MEVRGCGKEILYHDTILLWLLKFCPNFLTELLRTDNRNITQGVGDLQSALAIFEQFYGMSSVKLNPQKTELCCRGLISADAQTLARLSSFSLGILPFRYVRVPLVFGLLTDHDCQHLIVKVTSRSES